VDDGGTTSRSGRSGSDRRALDSVLYEWAGVKARSAVSTRSLAHVPLTSFLSASLML
jgi:hypothetical protein